MQSNYYTDTASLKEQYRDGTNLEDRMALHARFGRTGQDFQRSLFEHYDFGANARVLEVGGGTSLLWTKNRDRILRGWQVILTDFSMGMLDASRSSSIPVLFAQVDAQAIPFGSGYFDAVLANHMLYHVPNLGRALSEIRRVLKRGGTLYAVTNGERHMRELDELIVEIIGTSPVRVSLPFSLENGQAQLAELFGDVKRRDFNSGENDLVVTEVEPLLAYIKSMRVAKELLSPEHEIRFREVIAARIASEGAFRITRSVGLFEATAT